MSDYLISPSLCLIVFSFLNPSCWCSQLSLTHTSSLLLHFLIDTHTDTHLSHTFFNPNNHILLWVCHFVWYLICFMCTVRHSIYIYMHLILSSVCKLFCIQCVCAPHVYLNTYANISLSLYSRYLLYMCLCVIFVYIPFPLFGLFFPGSISLSPPLSPCSRFLSISS